MKTPLRLLVIAALAIPLVCCPFAFAQQEPETPPQAPCLIGRPNPAMADVNRLMVVIIPPPSEPNTDGLIWSQLTETIINKLDKAGIKITAAVAGNILEIPELRLNIDLLKLGDSQQYVFRVQTSFARKVLLNNNSEICIKADVFQADPNLQLVQTHDMPDAVSSAACQQVDAFIAVWSVAKQANKQPDVNRPLRRSGKLVGPRDTNAVKEQVVEYKFVASKNSKVFHKPDCSSAQKILPKNLVTYATRDEAIKAGKQPCQRCNP